MRKQILALVASFLLGLMTCAIVEAQQPAATPPQHPVSTFHLVSKAGTFVVDCYSTNIKIRLSGPGHTIKMEAEGKSVLLKPENGLLFVTSGDFRFSSPELKVNKDDKLWLDCYIMVRDEKLESETRPDTSGDNAPAIDFEGLFQER